MADVAGFFKKTLPALAAGVASQVPGPVGLVAQLVSNVLGKTVKADPSEITAAIAGATPDQILKLKEDDQNFQSTMQKLGFDDVEKLAELAVEDRTNARAMQVSTKSWTAPALAWTVVILCFLGEGLYFRLGAPANASPELIGRILGTLDSALILVLSYYFGSSAGSADKNTIISNLSNNSK